MSKAILLAGMLTVAAISNAHAMRCGTHLINEGDPIIRAIQLCGTPTQDNYSNVIYMNKDGDGMNYFLHVDGAGMIDSIGFSRGSNGDNTDYNWGNTQ